MSGVAVIRTLLAADVTLTAVVPATKIMAGDLPMNTSLPAISVKQISSVPYNAIKVNDTNKLHTDRVQVNVFVKEDAAGGGYPTLGAILTLVLAACPSQRGTVGGVALEAITPGHEGPDFYIDQLSAVTRSRDFIVRYIK